MCRFLTADEHPDLITMPGNNVLLHPGTWVPTSHRDLRIVESLLIQSRAGDLCQVSHSPGLV